MQEYTYKKIKDLYKNELKELQNGQPISSYNAKLNVTYGYALDMIDISRKTKYYLDLSMNTNKNIGRITMEMYQINIKKGLTLEENKADLIKKVSAYELLVHYNFFKETQMFKVELCVEKEYLSLKLNKDKLDVYSLISECVKKDFLFGNDLKLIVDEVGGKEENAENIIAVNYERFYSEVKKMLIAPINMN